MRITAIESRTKWKRPGGWPQFALAKSETFIALAPSDRWVAFTLALPDETAGLYLAKIGDQPASFETWTKIDEDRNYIGSPT